MAVSFERRFASFRASLPERREAPMEQLARTSSAAAERLAAEVDGELLKAPGGAVVRLESRGDVLPVDRERLARLPGQPPPGVPLVCLDTETTGLATASGTLAFLVGLGWWQGARFRQVQLLLPDHAFEPVLLDTLRDHIPPGAWLVTYNGRTFDWPLLVARYRLARQEPPVHAGHLDLLPFVRRVFRHRLPDARLRTVESEVLGIRRAADVAGWEIPERYFAFLRGGAASPLRDVIDHNEADVRALALLVGHVERRFGDVDGSADGPPGDFAGLGRAYARERRLDEALACLDTALAAMPGRASQRDPFGRSPVRVDAEADDLSWVSPRRPADFGGPPTVARRQPWPAIASAVVADPWTGQRMLGERAHLLRRLGRHQEAEAAWMAITESGGRPAVHAWIEVAKLREHRLRDPAGALEATLAASRLVRRQYVLHAALRRLDGELAVRASRLRRQAQRQALATSGSAARLAHPSFRPPHGVGHPLGPRRRPFGALDPPQKGPPS
jgi:hypothetical protein